MGGVEGHGAHNPGQLLGQLQFADLLRKQDNSNREPPGILYRLFQWNYAFIVQPNLRDYLSPPPPTPLP